MIKTQFRSEATTLCKVHQQTRSSAVVYLNHMACISFDMIKCVIICGRLTVLIPTRVI